MQVRFHAVTPIALPARTRRRFDSGLGLLIFFSLPRIALLMALPILCMQRPSYIPTEFQIVFLGLQSLVVIKYGQGMTSSYILQKV